MLLLLFLIFTEIVFCGYTLVTKQAHYKEKGIVRLGELAVIGIGLLAGLWGLGTSLYVIAVLLLVQGGIAFLKGKRQVNRGFRISRQIGICLGNCPMYFLILIPLLLFPVYQPPIVTGSLPVATAEYTWTDTGRIETFTDTGEYRALTVKFWYPEGPKAQYPLVVFSHGAFGVIDSNYSTCMELASHGYVVASIAHPYHAMFVKDTSGKITIANIDFVNSIYATNDSADAAVNYAQYKEWMTLRTSDENFVLDTILAKAAAGEAAPFALIDSDKIGLMGHSMGGASSVQLGRERKDIDAVIDLEGTMFGEIIGVADNREVLREDAYPVPILDVYSEEIYRLACELPEDTPYTNSFLSKRALCYDYVIFQDAGHLNFTDLPLISPTLAKLLGVGKVDARSCIENVNDMTLHFFDRYLKEDSSAVWKRVYEK